jgi:pyruvate/2-oxoglutarate/acetoin dehydrogenase E1 component
MTDYVEYINARIRTRMSSAERLIAYGQNIAAGSHLSGLTRGLAGGRGSSIINTPNIENALAGIGFGVMLRGMSAIFFCKQQDFLLLGMDHIVNTYNAIRHRSGLGSFSIVAIVVDSGFEGPQSGLHNLSDICSIAQVPGYLIAGSYDADIIIDRHLISPGFRLIGVSQRLFRTPVIGLQGMPSSTADGDIIQYSDGGDATVVAFGLALPQAIAITRAIDAAHRTSALFSVSNVWMPDWTAILSSLAHTGRLVIVDDGKSANRQSDRFLKDALLHCRPKAVVDVGRRFSIDWAKPNADQLEVDVSAILSELGLPSTQSA